jgi:hypothetical protein
MTAPTSPPFDPAQHPRRLNLGCGFDHRDGYLNVDFQDRHEPDLVADVRQLSMLPTGGYTELLAIDVLEHLPRSATPACLDEWARLLEPGGHIELQVPDVVACGRLLCARDTVAAHQQLIHQLWGTQAYTGDFHLAGFTDLLLVSELSRAGFHRIHLETRDGWMLVATAEKIGDVAADPLAVGWVGGFYGREGDAKSWWRWCDDGAELLVFNTSDRPIEVSVGFGVSRPDGRKIDVDVRAGRTADRIRAGRSPAQWSQVISVAPGPLRVRLSSADPPMDVSSDPRRLVFHLDRPGVELL